jgi:hypothetical protein
MSNPTVTITTIDRTAARLINEAIEKALTEVFAEFGLDTPKVSLSYLPTQITAKVQASLVSDRDDGINENSPSAQEYLRYGSTIGIEPGRLGVVFEFGMQRYRFAGINLRRPKYPISAINVASGRTYKLPETAANAINVAPLVS